LLVGQEEAILLEIGGRRECLADDLSDLAAREVGILGLKQVELADNKVFLVLRDPDLPEEDVLDHLHLVHDRVDRLLLPKIQLQLLDVRTVRVHHVEVIEQLRELTLGQQQELEVRATNSILLRYRFH